jgi:hypothetical protein
MIPDQIPARKPFQTPCDQAAGARVGGLSRTMPIARVSYGLLRQAAIRD